MTAETIHSGSGRAFLAPYGTALPDSTADMASLPVAFIDLGEIHEDGLEHVFSVDKEVIKNWEGVPVKIVSTSSETTFKLTFLETNAEVLKAFYGADIVTDGGTGSKIELGAPADVDYCMVIAVEDKSTSKLKVYTLERVQVADRDSINDKPGQAGYGMTFQALKSPTSGKTGYLLLDDDLTGA